MVCWSWEVGQLSKGDGCDSKVMIVDWTRVVGEISQLCCMVRLVLKTYSELKEIGKIASIDPHWR